MVINPGVDIVILEKGEAEEEGGEDEVEDLHFIGIDD